MATITTGSIEHLLNNLRNICSQLSAFQTTTTTLLVHLEDAIERLGDEHGRGLATTLSKTRDQLRAFTNLSHLRTFLRQSEIRQILDELQSEVWLELRITGKMTELDIESQQASYELNHKIDRLDSARKLKASLQADKTSVDDIRNLPAKELHLLMESIQVEISNGDASSRVYEGCLHSLRSLAEKAGLPLNELVHVPDLTSTISVNYRYPVGGGGLSDVFKASLKDKDTVAVKVLRVHYSGTHERVKRRVLKEASLWMQLRHPNVLPCLGIIDPGGNIPISIVSPWMDNGTVVDYMKKNPSAQTLKLAQGIARGLDYLHTHQPSVVHGDLTSYNVLVSDTGDAMLSGFGLASIEKNGDGVSDTQSSSRIAYRWSAPELISNDAEFPTKEADIWAFGMTVYQIITGQLPYHQVTMEALVVIALHQKKLPPSPTEDCLSKQSNQALWELVKKCWNFDKNERPDSRAVLDYVEDVARNAPLDIVLKTVSPTTEAADVSPLVQLDSDPYNHITPGTFGETRRATLIGRGRVALKVLRTPKFGKPLVDYSRKMHHEVKNWLELHSKNVLPPIGFAHPAGLTDSLVLPWMQNGDAFTYVHQNRTHSCLAVLADVARGLSYLHNSKPAIVHGDLKAANVLITDTGNAVLCDFGLASVVEEVTDLPYHRALENLGNCRWIAPELLFTPDWHVNREADIWSLGMVIYELLALNQPFYEKQQAASVVLALNSGERPARPGPEAAVRGLSDEVWKLIQSCWDSVPSQRPSADDVLNEFIAFVGAGDAVTL